MSVIYGQPITFSGNGGGIGPDDIVDNLVSEDVDKALSANQGRVLNEKKIEKMDSYIAGHLTSVVSGGGVQDSTVFVDTNEGLIVDATNVFGATWDLTLLSSGWTASSGNYVQTVNAVGLDHHFTLLGWVDKNATDEQRKAYSRVVGVESSADGTVTFTCTIQPSVDIPVHVKYHEATNQKSFDDFVLKSDLTFASNGKLDTTGIFDSALNATQSSLNASLDTVKILTNEIVTYTGRYNITRSYGYICGKHVHFECIGQIEQQSMSINDGFLYYNDESVAPNPNFVKIGSVILDTSSVSVGSMPMTFPTYAEYSASNRGVLQKVAGNLPIGTTIGFVLDYAI